MIQCRTRNIPMRTEPEEDGYHRFSLDVSKHDPFAVLQRLMAACGAPADTEASAARWNAMLAARAEREAKERSRR